MISFFFQHSTGVWALLVTENFTHVISGSRDKKIYMTEIRNPSNTVLVCEESAPVLSLCYNIDQTGIWVSTTYIVKAALFQSINE